MNGKKIFGDYQTPLEFADKVCELLKYKYNLLPKVVIEPTCGIGNFLKACLSFGAEQYYGIEINANYYTLCKDNVNSTNLKIINKDYFSCGINGLIDTTKQNLIIGNPPWITNSTLSKEQSLNLPHKSNIKSLRGFDALTGASNFDICEYIILDIIKTVKESKTTVAMLCKTTVARNIFKELSRKNCIYNTLSIYEFNAKKIFNVNTSACLIVIEFNKKSEPRTKDCLIFDFDNPYIEKDSLYYENGYIYSRKMKETFLGKSCFEWRQGVKHDCSKIMELTVKDDKLINGFNEIVNIEDTYTYPLIKSSMFKYAIIDKSPKKVIVTQSKVKEDTNNIKIKAPSTWEYLNSNIDYFLNRKSKIYKNTPIFSMFGIGDYTFSLYKVAISGFYKEPLFSLLYDKSKNKPMMTDDTSYFISFSSYDIAYIAMLCLNCEKVRTFIKNISFQDSKRPYTKEILKKIDFLKIIRNITFDELKQTENKLQIPAYATTILFDEFKKFVIEVTKGG